MTKKDDKIAIFWFRRDLRLHDNTALSAALKGEYPVLPVFIIDTAIVDELPEDDHRITFIYENLTKINASLNREDVSLLCLKGDVPSVWKKLLETYNIQTVYANSDYEPYARRRDSDINNLLKAHDIGFKTYKDHVVFEKNEVMKKDGSPYTVFTPYKRQWLNNFPNADMTVRSPQLSNLFKAKIPFPTLNELGFQPASIKAKPFQISNLDDYEKYRNFPSLDATSYLSVHLRFGTVSIREMVTKMSHNEAFLSELIWREFFIQILYHFPKVVDHNFKAKYNHIEWRNNEDEFKRWCEGKTGYPIVDAGMRELNQTGYMHNRVRMIVAGFLCKHLLIDWRWGESYFAKKLFDFELASNNGNWQWSAGTGCDAAPYFRIFNPTEQIKKFDPEFKYIKKWVPELDTFDYPPPMVDHKAARARALNTYKIGIENEGF